MLLAEFILQPRALAELVLNGWIRPTKGGLASAGSVRSRSGIAINDLLLEMGQFHWGASQYFNN